MTVMTATTTVHPARQQAIASYLDKLQEWCNSPAGSKDLDLPAKISIGRQELAVDPWERGMLQQFFRGAEDGLQKLLAHGLALVIKSTLDVERLKKHELTRSAEIYALQAELMLDAAIGIALLHEADLAIASEVKGGAVDTAKTLSVFRHKLARAVADAKKHIADSDRKQAEALAGSLTDRPLTVAAPDTIAASSEVQTLIDSAEAAIDEAPRPRRRKRRRRLRNTSTSTKAVAPAKPLLQRTGVLALAAASLAALWLVAVQLPPILGTNLVAVQSSQIAGSADLTVTARPPSLFVTLPAAQWDAMSEDLQQELIDSISAVASREDYVGALLTTDEGRPVARWLRSRGGERLLQRESGP